MKVVPKKGLRVSILLRYKLFFISSEIAYQVFFSLNIYPSIFHRNLPSFSTKGRKVWKDKRMLQSSITKCFHSLSLSTSILIRSTKANLRYLRCTRITGARGGRLRINRVSKGATETGLKTLFKILGVFFFSFFSVKFILGLLCNAHNFIHVKNDYRPTAKNLLEK